MQYLKMGHASVTGWLFVRLLAASVLGFLPGSTMASDTALKIAPVPTTPVSGTFNIAAVGDLMYLRPMLVTLNAQSPGLVSLLRSADVTFGNLETAVLDLKSSKAVPQAEAGGTWMLAEARVVNDLAEMGFDILSHANNHSTDWGVEGMTETIERVENAGLIMAGTGRNLSAARAPQYLDTKVGRVSLVAATTSFKAGSRAADPLGEVQGRGGANAIRSQRVAIVSESDFDVLKKLSRANDRSKADENKPVKLEGVRYESTASPQSAVAMTYELHQGDLDANLRSVRQARQNSNFTIFSLHNHEPGNWSEVPANFAAELAHKVIDAGADMYIGHGPHQLRGIEIYKNKPIFYSLGNFAMMNNSLDVIPPDMFDQFGVAIGTTTVPEFLQGRNKERFSDIRMYESVIAVTQFKDGVLSAILLHPIELGVNLTGAARGVPRTADRATAIRTLQRLQKLSTPYGTTIVIENGIGVIRLAQEKN